MTFDKGGHILKNKKKDWFSHETGLVFVYDEVLKGGSRNSTTFKMEVFGTIGNDRKVQRASSDWLTTGADTGCFQHWYTDFEQTNLGVPKFKLKGN